jgi:hypothetical protein
MELGAPVAAKGVREPPPAHPLPEMHQRGCIFGNIAPKELHLVAKKTR